MNIHTCNADSLRGVITALVTPFNRGRPDLSKYTELVQLAANAGITGIVPLGTTGESPVLTEKDRDELTNCAVKNSCKKLLVIVGAGTNNSRKTLENTQKAAASGADAVLIVTPYYNKPTPEALKKYFLNLADSSDLPIVLYHIPGRCGVGIPLELTLELAQHEKIIGVKEAGGDVTRSGEIARRSPDDFAVLSGDDVLTLPLMSVGAAGVISVISNLAPRTFKRMVDSALNDKFVEARSIHNRLMPLLKALSLETNPGPIKEAMNLCDMKVGQVQSPLDRVQPSTRKAIRQALKTVGKLD